MERVKPALRRTASVGILRPIPGIAFVPLAVLFFGIGELPKVIIIFFTTTLYVALNAEGGVRDTSENYRRLAQSVGAHPARVVLHVIMPAALPQIFTGIKIATALAWALVVAAELVAAQEGIGYMVVNAATFSQMTAVYVGIALIGICGAGMEAFVRSIEGKTVHWRGWQL